MTPTPPSSSTATTTTGSPPTPSGSSSTTASANVKLMNGGRKKWIAEGRADRPPTSPKHTRHELQSQGPNNKIRAFRDEVLKALDDKKASASSTSAAPKEYSGELLAPENLPQEGSQRGGHIPGAKNIPWGQAVAEDGTFKSREELEQLYGGQGDHPRPRTSSPTAASASAPPTPGSCSPTCWATRTSATTTAPGPSGAPSWARRSRSKYSVTVVAKTARGAVFAPRFVMPVKCSFTAALCSVLVP